MRAGPGDLEVKASRWRYRTECASCAATGMASELPAWDILFESGSVRSSPSDLTDACHWLTLCRPRVQTQRSAEAKKFSKQLCSWLNSHGDSADLCAQPMHSPQLTATRAGVIWFLTCQCARRSMIIPECRGEVNGRDDIIISSGEIQLSDAAMGLYAYAVRARLFHARAPGRIVLLIATTCVPLQVEHLEDVTALSQALQLALKFSDSTLFHISTETRFVKACVCASFL